MAERTCGHCGVSVTRRGSRGPWPKWCDAHRDRSSRSQPAAVAPPVGGVRAGGTLESVAVAGDRVQTLRVLRDRIAASIDACESDRDLAALSRQLTDVLAQIAELAPEVKEVSPLDELASRRRKSS